MRTTHPSRRAEPAAPAAPPPPLLGRREANKRDKAARIRDAALALLQEKGFAATTTREVAERADVAAGTLFLYVRSKEDLVGFVFREEISRISDERFASVPRRRGVVDQLCHLFEGLLEFYARDRALSQLLLREALFAPAGAESMALTTDFLARAAALVDAAVARGELTGAAPSHALAVHAFALYLGAVLAVVNGAVPAAADAVGQLRAALEIHFAGQRPPRTRVRTRGDEADEADRGRPCGTQSEDTMTAFVAPDDLTLGAARDLYFEANGFGADGGYSSAWVDFKLGPIPMPFPNTQSRVRAVKLHDLHHALTGYATDTIGEFEISAWELGGGCGGFAAAWVLNLGGLAAGTLAAPRRTFRAFVRGRRSQTLYRGGGAAYDAALLARPVREARAELGLDDRGGAVDDRPAGASDVALFAATTAAGLAVGAVTAALIVPIAVAANVAALVRRRGGAAASGTG